MSPLVLETIAADGTVLVRTPLVIGVTLVQAQPGNAYRVVNDLGGRVTNSALVHRVGDDLRIDLPQDRNVSLEGFFSRCSPGSPCTLSMENIGGLPGETVTPATQPVVELPDGGLLMYASGAPAAPAPAEDSAFSFKPLAGIAGGLAIIAGAAGGGGGSGSSSGDTVAPDPPRITSSPFTRLAHPAFTGTAEPGAKVTLTLFDTTPVTYETTAASDGTWLIDTAVDAPRLGARIALAEGVSIPLGVIATDASGNASAIATGTVTLDTIALPAPIITSPLVTADTTPAIRGTAEPGSRVTLALDLDRDGNVDATWTTVANDSGVWSIDLANAPASGSLPGGQLTDGSSTGITVTASDNAGNASPATTAVLRVDTSLPPAPTIGVVSGDDAVNAAEAGVGVTISGTLPEADRPVSVSWGGVTIAATVSGTSWTAVFAPGQIPGADGTAPVTASYLSADGATSEVGSRGVLIDRIAPLAPSIAAVPENSGGGINAVEASDGTQVRISLAGTGAAAGDHIVLTWGGTAVATHTISATELGGGLATITVAGSALAGLPDGTGSLVARIDDLAGNAGAPSEAFVVTLDRSPPAAGARITTVTDDVPLVTGSVANGGVTNDSAPTVSGTLSATPASGDVVEVLRNGQPVGFATVSGTSWSFGDSGLPDGGTYTYTARVVDGAGNRGSLGSGYSIVVDTTAPNHTLVDADVVDNVKPGQGSVADGGTTNDTRPELTLKLDAVLSSGESLRIYRSTDSGDASMIGVATRDRGTTYSYTEDSPLARGSSYTYSADVADAAGNLAPLPLKYTITVI